MLTNRSSNFNVDMNAIKSFSEETVLAIYKQMTTLRVFEKLIVQAAQSGRFQIKIHMSSGQEAVAAAIAQVVGDYQIFTQHRTTDLYLALGGSPEMLRDEMLCLDSGCCGGKIGGAFQLFKDGRRMYAHTGLIGENISVGVGAALGNGQKTLCLFGDGAAEEDYALEAYGFAATHHLPVLFVCTDNNLSVLSPLKRRRSWELVDVAKGFGLTSIDISDDPFTLMNYLKEFDVKLPALINCRVCRNYWHAGVGIDGKPEWDRYEILKDQLLSMNLGVKLTQIDQNVQKRMEEIWKNYL